MFTKDNKLRVLEVFFKKPTTQLHIREIAEITGLSPPGALKILNKLENENLLIKRKDRVTTKYRLNLENEESRALKRAYNTYSIHSTGLLQKLIEHYNTPETIVLFGSYAKAEDLEGGDIDIAITTEKEEYPKLKSYEEELDRKIALHLIKDIQGAEPEFKNTLANGVVLFGYLEVI